MTERKLMTVKIIINDPGQDWIVGRVSGMIDSIANDGNGFLMSYGYPVSRRGLYAVNREPKSEYTLQADVSLDEFNKIVVMLDRAYGNKKLFDYTVECDW